MYIPKEQVVKEVTAEYLDTLDVTNLPAVPEMVGQLFTTTNDRLQAMNTSMPKGMTYRMTDTITNYQVAMLLAKAEGPVQRPAQHLRPASPRNLPEIRAQSGAVLAFGRRSGPDYLANAPWGIGKGHTRNPNDTTQHRANQAADAGPGPCTGG